MELVDTHMHLGLIEEREGGAGARALQAARVAGVTRVICIGLGPDNALVAAEADPGAGVYATAGWHPHETESPGQDDLDVIRDLAASRSIVAIGEIGLDYYWRPGYHEVPAEIQRAGFRKMLGLALELDLPVVIHDRDAHDDTLSVLLEFPGTRGTMHAFSGDAAFARACLEVGLHLSIAGPVTYPRAETLREAVREVPLDRLLVETDAPFLPPQPWRGQANEPAYVVETARRVAELKGLTLEEFAEASTGNAVRLFGL